MVNPGAFKGSRKEFLSQQKVLFSEAVAKNHVSDTVADIQRRYFKRFPISLHHDEEPSPEWLAQVDDNSPDEEIKVPDQDALSSEEYTKALADYDAMAKLFQFRKEQIRRRLVYEYQKDEKQKNSTPIQMSNSDSCDPTKVLMAQLTGVSLKKPRLRTGYNVWGPQHRFLVDPVFEERVKASAVPQKYHAALRSQIYKELFNELGEDEKKDWEDRARAEHKAALEAHEGLLKNAPSEKPEDRQKVINSLPNCVQPVLDLIAAHTGWKVTLIAGGPEPADNGRLNMISVHSGKTKGSLRMNFGKSERRAYSEYIIPIFGNFLKKCYTIEECRGCTLEPEARSLANVLANDNDKFTLDSTENCESVKIKGLSKLRTVSSESSESSKTFSREHSIQPTLTNTKTSNARTYTIHDTPSTQIHAKEVENALPEVSTNNGQGVSVDSNVNGISAVPSHFLPRRTCQSPPPSLPVSRAPSPCQIHDALPLGVDAPSGTESTSPRNPGVNVPSEPDVLARLSMLADAANSSINGHNEPTVLDAPIGGIPLIRRRSVSDEDDSDKGPSRKKQKGEIVPFEFKVTSQGRRDLFDAPAARQSTWNGVIWPAWFSDAVDIFKSEPLTISWVNLLGNWIAFQEKAGFDDNGKLGTTSRPPCISAWIKNARSPMYDPNINDLPKFRQQFKRWWLSLQPEWRVSLNGSVVLKRVDGNLDVLKKQGKNGMYSVLAALWFWGLAAKGKDREGGESEWEAAVEDVSRVVKALAS